MSNKRIFLALTGGGTECVGKILRNGGASSYFVGAVIPYSVDQLKKCIGGDPHKYCTKEVAEKMAVVAWQEAAHSAPVGVEIIGIGVTASLTKANQRKDRINEAHIVVQDNCTIKYHYVNLNHIKNRVEQENVLSDIITTKVETLINDGLIYSDEFTMFNEELMNVYTPHPKPVVMDSKMQNGEYYTLFPGSFHPFHNGHLEVAEISHNVTTFKVVFELSIINYDKPIIAVEDVIDRTNKIMEMCEKKPWYGGIVVSCLPLFSQKIQILKPEYIILGQDTAIRLYNSLNCGDITNLLLDCSKYDTHLLVFNRKGYEEEYKQSKHNLIHNYSEFEHYIIDIQQYKDDGISSTILRNIK